MHLLKSNFLLLVVFVLTIRPFGTAPESLGSQDPVPEALGDFPMCEASSAVWLGGDRLLVGDNEVTKTLFTFPFDADGRLETEGTAVSLGTDVEISDIEALAGLGNGEVVVFGSHSRNKYCRDRRKRRRFLRGRLTVDGFVASGDGVVEMRKKVSCEGLFGNIPSDKLLLAAVCDRIDAVKEAADEIWDPNGAEVTMIEACNEAQPFNAEGAMAVSDSSGESLWIGLRSPLLPAASADRGDDMAILLRMKDLQEYTFDEAALVDLGGAGIRELAVSNGWVLGIAGPPEDSSVGFRLWMFPVGELQAGATIKPTFVESLTLPTSSEGLAIVGSIAHVIIDGDHGKDKDDDEDGKCAKPARYLAVPMPR